MSSDIFHAVVVGGSFAGLSAAMQLARARRHVLVVDSGLPRNRFARASHGFLGQDGRTPAEILDTAREQLLAYPTVEFRRDEATAAAVLGSALERTFEIVLASSGSVRARRLILATGIIDDLPEIPGLRERWGTGVLHCPYCHGFEVAGQRLGILAVNETSAHVALLLPDWSDDVTFFTHGSIDLMPAQREALAARGVRLEQRAVVQLFGDGAALSAARLEDGTMVSLDALFTASRTRMASGLAAQLGCAFDEGPFGPLIRTDARRETTVPGVYAAGDAVRAPHNATWASSDGVTAGISAHQSLALG